MVAGLLVGWVLARKGTEALGGPTFIETASSKGIAPKQTFAGRIAESLPHWGDKATRSGHACIRALPRLAVMSPHGERSWHLCGLAPVRCVPCSG